MPYHPHARHSYGHSDGRGTAHAAHHQQQQQQHHQQHSYKHDAMPAVLGSPSQIISNSNSNSNSNNTSSSSTYRRAKPSPVVASASASTKRRGSKRRGSKRRVTTANLCEYFSSQSTTHGEIMDVIVEVMTRDEYRTLRPIHQHALISSEFIEKEVAKIDYGEELWGKKINEIRELGMRRKQHEVWQDEIAKLKKKSHRVKKPKAHRKSHVPTSAGGKVLEIYVPPSTSPPLPQRNLGRGSFEESLAPSDSLAARNRKQSKVDAELEHLVAMVQQKSAESRTHAGSNSPSSRRHSVAYLGDHGSQPLATGLASITEERDERRQQQRQPSVNKVLAASERTHTPDAYYTDPSREKHVTRNNARGYSRTISDSVVAHQEPSTSHAVNTSLPLPSNSRHRYIHDAGPHYHPHHQAARHEIGAMTPDKTEQVGVARRGSAPPGKVRHYMRQVQRVQAKEPTPPHITVPEYDSIDVEALSSSSSSSSTATSSSSPTSPAMKRTPEKVAPHQVSLSNRGYHHQLSSAAITVSVDDDGGASEQQPQQPQQRQKRGSVVISHRQPRRLSHAGTASGTVQRRTLHASSTQHRLPKRRSMIITSSAKHSNNTAV